ncbi:hypothetical protein KUTeg_006565 [Tegillarca granosa]|uniref:THAP-type domain-containing protein n=1 Tax=Tegillarca granosa TaxID=220873 RepID=A0ABQ9FF19_TEGGR|nr:hypothetical protein KUTeg_006565 [Tegillarca granosa]
MGGHDHCCVVNCTNRRGTTDVSFHRIPAQPKSRRSAWIRAISRKEHATKNWVVCGAHFQSGKPSKDPADVDYIPTLLPHKTQKHTVPRYSHLKRLCEDPDSESSIDSSGPDSDNINHDHSYHLECTDPLLKELNKKDEKIMMLEEKIRELEFQMGKLKFRLETFEDDDNMIRFYTGFPSYKAFWSFFTFLEPRAKWMRRWRGSETSTPSIAGTEAGLGRRKLKLQDELFAVLARLRLNLLVSDISLRLGINRDDEGTSIFCGELVREYTKEFKIGN